MTGPLRAAYAGYLVAVAWLVWSPDPGTPASAVVHLTTLLRDWGLPATETWVERGLNVVMFVPLSLLGAWVLDRWRVLEWGVAGLALTLLIEGVQHVAIPTRSGTVSDVVANTAGALVGIALAGLSRRVLGRRRAGSPR